MKKQTKPIATNYRMYPYQIVAIKKAARVLSKKRKEDVSGAQVVREAVEAYVYTVT